MVFSEAAVKEKLLELLMKDGGYFLVCQFVARSALRALPLLTFRSGFIYWQESERIKNILAVLAAVEISFVGSIRLADNGVANVDEAFGARAIAASKLARSAAIAAYRESQAVLNYDKDDVGLVTGVYGVAAGRARDASLAGEAAKYASGISAAAAQTIGDVFFALDREGRESRQQPGLQKIRDSVAFAATELARVINTSTAGARFQESMSEAALRDLAFIESDSGALIDQSLWWSSKSIVIEWNERFIDGVEQLARSLPDQSGELLQIIERFKLFIISADELKSSSAHLHVSNGDNFTSVTSLTSGIVFEATHKSQAEIPAKNDKLNRQRLVNALAINLINKTNSHHRTIGLLGEWGAGKTTVLDLLKERLRELREEQKFIFGEFNAWAYEHSDNIQAGIAQEMINALTSPSEKRESNGKSRKNDKIYNDNFNYYFSLLLLLPQNLLHLLNTDVQVIRSWILRSLINLPLGTDLSLGWFFVRCGLTIRYAIKTHPFQLFKIALLLLGAAMPWISDWFADLIEFSAGSDKSKWIWAGGITLYTLRELGKLIISPQAKELLTYLRLPSYAEYLGTIPVMRKNICTLCELRLKEKKGASPRLLFVVDDLDRCSPAAIVKVLEAVRLVLDLKNVIVIIAIDQHVALAALSEHYKDFSPHHKLKNSHAIAREYLSKVINLPVVLTKPSDDDVRGFVTSFWDEMNNEADKVISENNKSNTEMTKTSANSRAGEVAADNIGRKGEGASTNASVTGDGVTDALIEPVNSGNSLLSVEGVDPPLVIKPVKALSRDQQESFIYWVNYFALSNSRQLKRLNNSYDLMRSYLPLMDKDTSDFTLTDSQSVNVFPMLLTLILMEYLNNLHDLKERNQLWGWLFTEFVASPFEVVGNKIVTPRFIDAYRSLLAAEGNQSLIASVEAFVLPAMN